MKHSTAIFPSIATLSLALLLPACAQTGTQNGQYNNQNGNQNGNQQGSQNWNGSNANPRGQREAMHMVADRAALDKTLEADKAAPGAQFRATLEKTVQLDNGPQLPRGTMLLGTVGTDDMNEGGTSKLALCFNEAVLKDGQHIPIKATIVGVYPPSSMNSEGNPVAPGDEVPNSWTDGTLAVDQIGVMSGVDLHSRIRSKNSGVFVSTKDNVKLPAGSEMALAIAAQRSGRRNHNQNGQDGNNGNQNGMNGAPNQSANPQ